MYRQKKTSSENIFLYEKLQIVYLFIEKYQKVTKNNIQKNMKNPLKRNFDLFSSFLNLFKKILKKNE